MRFINTLIPKRPNQILFVSIPDYSDNAKALFEYLNHDNDGKNYILIWSLTDEKLANKLSKIGIRTCMQMSIGGLYQLFRSKYLVATHNTFGGFKAKNQFLINLWHGMPLKSMGFLDGMLSKKEKEETIQIANSIDLLISTSAITRNALVSCFGINPKKVHIRGQPRNDNLFSKNVHKNLSKLLNLDILKYQKIVLFTPTYRIWADRTDGIRKKDNVFNFHDYDEELFERFLKDNQTLFLFKLHPQEEEFYLNKFKVYNKDNIILISTQMLNDNLMDIHDFLGAIDILITDYSSIYFDFLLLNRPIIFVSTDLNEYSKSRGFVLEPYDFWTPGPKTNTFNEFLKELTNSFNEKYYEDKRLIVNDIINTYIDSNSCKRVFDLMKKYE